METLSSDTLFALAMSLELPELLRFCSSSKKINDLVCKRDNIWYYKLDKEFPNWREGMNSQGESSQGLKSQEIKNPKTLIPISEMKTPRDIYIGLYWYNIFKTQMLILGNNDIKVIPAGIGKLSNLQHLSLNNNQIKVIPSEIGQLSNLQILNLRNNMITVIPSEIKKMKYYNNFKF